MRLDASRLSIITVTRNNLDGLKRTGCSVLSQSFQNYEWIVVDGASTDDTVCYLQGLPQSKLHWVSEPDRGIYDAMNKAIELCSGEYLLFLNAGDEFASCEVLSQLIALPHEQGKPDLIYGDAFERTQGGNLLYKRCRSHRWLWYGMFAHHQSMFYRRAALGTIRYRQKYRVGADYALTAELLLQGGKALRFRGPICIFEQGGFSAQMVSLGRRDQWGIRRDIMKTNILFRSAIFVIQLLIGGIRNNFAGLYKTIRFSTAR